MIETRCIVGISEYCTKCLCNQCFNLNKNTGYCVKADNVNCVLRIGGIEQCEDYLDWVKKIKKGK